MSKSDFSTLKTSKNNFNLKKKIDKNYKFIIVKLTNLVVT